MLQCIRAKGRPDYGLWCKISAGTLHAFGGDKALAIKLLQEFFPEDDSGEYEKLFETEWTQITTGTLVHIAREHGYKGSVSKSGENILPPLKDAIGVGVLASTRVDHSKTLLGDRWLCRQGAALMVGSTGIGKSSASMQQDILWALGKEAFGIMPSSPLKILTIQAENDEGDLSTMAKGVMDGLGLLPEEREAVNDRALYVQVQGCAGSGMIALTDRYLERYKPDLLRLDPLQAFIGGDINSAEVTAEFLRVGLNPLLSKHDCGLILVHHTPKPQSGADKKRPDDWSHVGMGSSDIGNWARSGLYIESSHDRGVYRFRATKRGGAIGWKNEGGEKEFERWYKHGSGGWCWEPSAPSTRKAGEKQYSPEAVMLEVPLDYKECICKSTLVNRVNRNQGVPERRVKDFIEQLLDEGEIVANPGKQGIKGGRKPIMISRAKGRGGSYRDEKGMPKYKPNPFKEPIFLAELGCNTVEKHISMFCNSTPPGRG